uniref:Uncharacterized protein n=1 Tax=Solanum lycopersicum TaxID=4081 RepID=A0A3Q7GK71_SOLLC
MRLLSINIAMDTFEYQHSNGLLYKKLCRLYYELWSILIVTFIILITYFLHLTIVVQ